MKNAMTLILIYSKLAMFIVVPLLRCISQLIKFTRVCSHVDDFNARNKCSNAKLLKQGYRYDKLRMAFSIAVTMHCFRNSMSD